MTLVAPTTPRYDARNQPIKDTLNSAFIARILDAIGKNFVRPQHLTSNAYVLWRPTTASPVIFGEVAFKLTPSGGLAKAATSQSSLSDDLDQSLIDALYRADSAHSLPSASEAGIPEPPWFFLTLTSRNHPIGYGLQPLGYGVELFRERVPSWHEGSVPAQDPHHPMAAVNYPPQLVRQGFEGTLYVEFVIDEFGKAMPSTFRLMPGASFERPPNAVVSDPSPDVHLGAFVSAVAEALPNIRFIPGTVAGCAVKQLVVEPFAFSVRRR